jgi:hypothetical protein
MKTTIKLTGSDLALFNLADVGSPIRRSGFGTQFGPRQSVDATFHSVLSLSPFASLRIGVGGFLEKFSYKEGVEAYALLHVLAEVRPPAPPIRLGGLSGPLLSVAVESPREDAARLLAHELAHVRQAWMLNEIADKEYERAGPYDQNIFEQIAYSVADKFIAQNRSRIKQGAFDRFLPNWVTSAK